MLTSVDESALWVEYQQTHNATLREDFVLRYVPLVRHILGRLGIYRDAGNDYEDLVNQGLLGLIEAVDHYNPALGTQFSTYATLRVRGKILDYMRSQDWLSRSARHRARSVQQAINDFWKDESREPTDEEISEKLSIPVSEVQQALVDSNQIFVSLDSLFTPDQEGDLSLYDVLPDDRQEDPSEVYGEKDLKRILMQAIQELSEREQLVLSLYYFENLTFKEIGVVMDVTESRVCQLHARAILSLKAVMSHV